MLYYRSRRQKRSHSASPNSGVKLLLLRTRKILIISQYNIMCGEWMLTKDSR